MPRAYAPLQSRPKATVTPTAKTTRTSTSRATRTSRQASSAKSNSKSAHATSHPTTASSSTQSSSVLPRFLARSATTKKADLAKQPAVVRTALRDPGQPLPASTRAEMETRLQRDLSAVRVHTTPTAAKSATALNAAAYTLGTDTVFAPGRYSPNAPEGRRLLAHELTHVAQQTAPASTTAPASPKKLEAQADHLAATLDAPLSSHPSHLTPLSSAPLVLQRKVLNQTADVMPDPGDVVTVGTGGEGDWTYVHYSDHIKIIKAIIDPATKQSSGQIGPSWVANNPGNLTYDPKQDPKKVGPYAKAINRHCLAHGAFAEPLQWGPRPFAIFPTYADGRKAMIDWIKAIADPAPTDPDLATIPAKDRPSTIRSVLSTYAPAADKGSKNDPNKYTTAVTDAINARRKSQGLDPINPDAAMTISDTGSGTQNLNAEDMQAWSEGSETVEGGHSLNSWQIWIWESYVDKALHKKVTQFGGTFPKPTAKWCEANRIKLTPAP